jgi:chromosome segregation ATPase
MITLEQIRLLESRITRAVDLIRVLKEENSTLRRGLESAQKRMKELESLVEGFKSDQAEIESVIVRTLHSLDELEEGTSTRRAAAQNAATAPAGSAEPAAAKAHRQAVAESPPAAEARGRPEAPPPERAAKEELDIF